MPATLSVGGKTSVQRLTPPQLTTNGARASIDRSRGQLQAETAQLASVAYLCRALGKNLPGLQE